MRLSLKELELLQDAVSRTVRIPGGAFDCNLMLHKLEEEIAARRCKWLRRPPVGITDLGLGIPQLKYRYEYTTFDRKGGFLEWRCSTSCHIHQTLLVLFFLRFGYRAQRFSIYRHEGWAEGFGNELHLTQINHHDPKYKKAWALSTWLAPVMTAVL